MRLVLTGYALGQKSAFNITPGTRLWRRVSQSQRRGLGLLPDTRPCAPHPGAARCGWAASRARRTLPHFVAEDDDLVRVAPLPAVRAIGRGFSPKGWRAKIATRVPASEGTGRPPGGRAFVAKLEKRLVRSLPRRELARTAILDVRPHRAIIYCCATSITTIPTFWPVSTYR